MAREITKLCEINELLLFIIYHYKFEYTKKGIEKILLWKTLNYCITLPLYSLNLPNLKR